MPGQRQKALEFPGYSPALVWEGGALKGIQRDNLNGSLKETVINKMKSFLARGTAQASDKEKASDICPRCLASSQALDIFSFIPQHLQVTQLVS
jgi:hypothetical protein